MVEQHKVEIHLYLELELLQPSVAAQVAVETPIHSRQAGQAVAADMVEQVPVLRLVLPEQPDKVTQAVTARLILVEVLLVVAVAALVVLALTLAQHKAGTEVMAYLVILQDQLSATLAAVLVMV